MRWKTTLDQYELSALSTLVAFSHDSEDVQRNAKNVDTADDIRAARERLRSILYRTGTWRQREDFRL